MVRWKETEREGGKVERGWQRGYYRRRGWGVVEGDRFRMLPENSMYNI